MAKDYVDKTRTGIPGHPKLKGVTNSAAWGESAAIKRGYCKGTEVTHGPARGAGPYHPQFKEDQPLDPNYNDTRDKFLRGMSPNGGEDKPGYAHSWRAPRGDAKGYRDSDPLRQGGGAPRGNKNR
jgi:hypothetical protein